MKSNILLLKLCLLGCLSCLLASCASTPQLACPSPKSYAPVGAPYARNDLYHVVAPGETLWRISKMYDVRMDDIMCANRLPRADQLEMGQRLFIPGAAPLKPVIPLYPSRKWRYIIIHHSATDEGNALSLFALHNKRGWEGLGYHFVINNGTAGKKEGQIETSPRWLHQRDGAHCKASEMNKKGIGICLVGNYSEDRVSQEQMDSLMYLIGVLKDYYNIPAQNIMGHGMVSGAATECPGLNFPWKEFKRRLRELR
ncbi:MAG: N-acetylmuramoyl-L-alanine amidase [Candidatus Omnitrophica bacterium]|nr:N-acetylmuramoyl-L-alanine amidase [Candidatus Omnitrophota bacterium]